MIRLEKMTASTRPLAEALEVDPAQLRFVGTMDEILAITGGPIVPVLVWHQADRANIAKAEANNGEKLVGFFLLDKEYDREHDFAKTTDLGFRAFLIDVHHQGKGLGKAVMQALPQFVKARYPQFERLVLTVNLKNTPARVLYLKNGFIDTENQYLGGSAGPQHILYLPLG
ncbi:GNAT family N-acetyltransferase [Shewanella litorisediminis]|uniref:GNAT family N-acetyltransferase n=1 Tax=Shewanella litorisediminis TaxID=1173586 RepID=A0ABX7G6Y6_9GAMM|nr:GNAT family N-acetyltransferase [Shewanella litorisediminis]MCL2916720.1 GNAT family N-acetyltransferase [Shewanella litorisediminis]QRH03109.1 GNAT family N-acetyltransferase [Shewanella litorisediminis]